MLMSFLPASSYDFEVDGLYYNILSEEDRTVEVTHKYLSGDIPYIEGDIEIPKKLIYKSKTYTVISIGYLAFDCCRGLTSVTIPNSVTSIGSLAFAYCRGLTSVSIPNSVTSIGGQAFYSCESLTSVAIGNSVTSIGFLPFDGCSGLENIYVDPENTKYSSIDGILYSKDATILIKCPEAKTSVTIPNSVTSIGNSAFADCSGLTSMTIPNSVTSIGEFAFQYCSGLTSVTIPNSVTSIGGSAFSGCGNLTSVTIPNSVTSIGGFAFSGCSGLTSVTIPNSVTSIGNSAFANCRGLTSMTIPNSVTSIGNSAFADCRGLTSVTIPNSVTSIGEFAFQYCSGLTSVTIPNSVTSIGNRAFNNCDNLKSIYIQCKVPIECGSICDDNTLEKAILYVPKGTKTAYEKVDPWRNFWNIEEIDYKVTTISLPDAKDTLRLGEELTLHPIVEPDYATNPKVSYSSSDSNVVSCNGDGILKAVGLGSATITISACDGSGVMLNHEVRVVESLSGIESIKSDNDPIFIRTGNRTLFIYNKPETSIVRVFNLQGSLIKETEDSNVKNLAKGMYVITVEDRSFKVML